MIISYAVEHRPNDTRRPYGLVRFRVPDGSLPERDTVFAGALQPCMDRLNDACERHNLAWHGTGRDDVVAIAD